ncbi:hypothetical protein ARALYDRAFT_493402, partial [Arabidopsis lyrata subsp. lyrata]
NRHRRNCLNRLLRLRVRRLWLFFMTKSLNFRRLIASPEIYIERSVIRLTEHILYVAIRSQATKTLTWYTLNLKPFGTTDISHRLVEFHHSLQFLDLEQLLSLPVLRLTSLVDISMENLSPLCRFLPNMKEPRKCTAVGLIDGKLYVVRGCNTPSLNWVEEQVNCFVMNDKIYRMGQKTIFVYDPKKGRFEEDLTLNALWMKGFCPIDNMLYGFYLESQIFAYDLVKLEGCTGTIVNHGGRLAILFKKSPTEIWCTEIAMERAEEGGCISGVWSNHVLTLTDSFIIERALTVTV